MSEEYVPRFGLFPTATKAVEQQIETAIDGFIDQFGHMVAAGATMVEAYRTAIAETLRPVLEQNQMNGAMEAPTRLAIFDELLDRWGVPGRDWESVFDPSEIS